MAFRFRKRISIIPGLLTLNIGLKGISFTIGRGGASFSIGPQGGYMNMGLPGSGMSFRERIFSWGKKEEEKKDTERGHARIESIPAVDPHGNVTGLWLPLTNHDEIGLWLCPMTDAEKENVLFRLGNSSPAEKAEMWSEIVIGWKGNLSDEEEQIPYSRENVKKICQIYPDAFNYYAKCLNQTIMRA